MDIGFNHNCWAQSVAQTDESEPCAALEWAMLRTRFLAAHEARRAMQDSACVLTGGSFDPASARFVTPPQAGLASVNRVALSNGKALRIIDAVLADHTQNIGG